MPARRPRRASSTPRGGLDAARMRQLCVIELVGEPGMGKSRLVASCGRSRSASPSSRPPPSSTRRRRRSRLAEPPAPARRHHAGPLARGGRRAARAVGHRGAMPDLAPWLPLLAIPFDAKVPSTPEVDALDPPQPRAAPRDRRDIPRAHADDADADRRRGHALARRRVAGAAPPSRGRADAAAVARLRDEAPVGRADPDGGRPGTATRDRPAGPDSAQELALAVARSTRYRRRGASSRRRAGGNPLFLRELVFAARTVTGELPESVETLLTSRIDTLARPTGCCCATRPSSARRSARAVRGDPRDTSREPTI